MQIHLQLGFRIQLL